MKYMNVIMIMIALISISACSYTITLIHTEGVASDVVDETDTPSANVSIPVKGL